MTAQAKMTALHERALKAEAEIERLQGLIGQLRAAWFKGADLDRGHVSQVALRVIVEAKRSHHAKGEPLMTDNLRMDAYYYGFTATGVPEIDKILSAVACAGKAYHHTDCWNDESEWPPHAGKSPVDWIQNAANEAAAAFKRT